MAYGVPDMTTTEQQLKAATEDTYGFPVHSEEADHAWLDDALAASYTAGSVPALLSRGQVIRTIGEHEASWQELVNDWGFDPDKKQTFRAVEFFAWLGY